MENLMDSDICKIEEACLNEVKKRLKDQSNDLNKFSWLIDDDKFILHFVRGKKFKADRAVDAINHYFTIRRDSYKSFFLQLKEPHLDTGLNAGILNILKARDEQNRVYVTLNFSKWKDESLDEITRSIVLILEECWNFEEIERNGVVLLVNLQDFGWTHFKILNPMNVYRAVNIFWNNMPIRYKKIHLTKMGSLSELTLRSVKPFLPKTLSERLIIHSPCCTELYKEICPSKLPSSFGGHLLENEAFDEEFIRKIFAKRSYYRRFSDCL